MTTRLGFLVSERRRELLARAGMGRDASMTTAEAVERLGHLARTDPDVARALDELRALEREAADPGSIPPERRVELEAEAAQRMEAPV